MAADDYRKALSGTIGAPVEEREDGFYCDGAKIGPVFGFEDEEGGDV